MADVLYDALKPYVGAGWLNQQASGLNDYGWRNYTAIAGNRASFDPAESLNLMRTYNQTYGLGLTDAEIAAGIKKFGDWVQEKFGGGLAADSSIPAVAAQSLAEALTLKGVDGYSSPFWQDISKPGGVLQLGNEAAIKKGQEALAAIDTDWNNNLAVFGSGMSNGIGYDNSSGFQDFMMGAIPAAMAAIVGPAIAGEFAGGLGGLGGAAAGKSAALGSLGSGTLGVDLAGLGTYGTTSAMAGGLGTGLAETTLASLGLDAGALAGLGAAGVAGSGYTGTLSELAADGLGGVAETTGSGAMGWEDFGSSFLDGTAGANDALSQILNMGNVPAGATGFGEIGSLGLSDAASTAGKKLLSIIMGGGNGISGQTIGAGLSSLLGYKASQDQTSALNAQADKYSAMGAPYRQKLSDLYANPDSFLQSNEVQKPVQMGTTNLMRALSTTGNPFGSGNALQQGQSYASDQLFSRLGQEKDRLAGYGGLASYNAAAPSASNNAIQSGSNAWNALGAGVNNIFNPPQSSAQTMAEFYKMIGKV